jgi:predicted secreted acid phosphatase
MARRSRDPHLFRRRRIPRARWAQLALIALASALAGCAVFQPANLGDLKTQLTAYHDDGAYQRDLQAVSQAAQDWVRWRAPQVAKPALVLDIDETSLSNWPRIKANNFGYIADGPCQRLPSGPCGALAWDRTGQAQAIGPTLALFNSARLNGVTVFFITGRSESERAATERNLRIAGYHGWAAVIMRPNGTSTPSAADFKAPERAKIEANGYTIVANVGDQPSDLEGGHAERGFLLPDPFYRVP